MTESELRDHLVERLTERWMVLKSPRAIVEEMMADPLMAELLAGSHGPTPDGPKAGT